MGAAARAGAAARSATGPPRPFPFPGRAPLRRRSARSTSCCRSSTALRRGRDRAGPARARRRAVRRLGRRSPPSLCMDKDLFKACCATRGIPVARTSTLRLGDGSRTRSATRCSSSPRRSGSSVGISKVRRREELDDGGRARAPPRREGAGRGVRRTASEIEVRRARQPRAGRLASSGEIVAHADWYDYAVEVRRGRHGARGSAAAPRPRRRSSGRASSPSRRSWRPTARAWPASTSSSAAGRRGRRERAEHDPRLHRDERLRRLFAASGIAYEELLDRLVELALERHERRKGLEY